MTQRTHETTESAVARMAAAAQDAGVTVDRLGPAEFIVRAGATRAGLVLDEQDRSYRLTDVPAAIETVVRPGERAPGMYTWSPGILPVRATLLAGTGHTWEFAATYEKATRKWELQPTNDSARFAYAQLTEYGWHRTMGRRAAALLIVIAALLAVVAVGLVTLVGVLAGPVWLAVVAVLIIGPALLRRLRR
ncbi:hypothetical protein P0W64_20945 [Tsukamurella sp. 8F]|uniref:hypothetical protein n=1 Tax=unclassified Tsukamurella TaxID=2633480 RepID=UPI0023B99006|nr:MULTISPECIES: hypothetical protein [unclassified Tsukamurella]MDF0532184.1 hypothetical protein [Tsukamurella sp. 8J]MDF0589253.1 hypothetical protein [Tsukamurella sp. 8F]